MRRFSAIARVAPLCVVATAIWPGGASAAPMFTGPTNGAAGANPSGVVLVDANLDLRLETVTANAGSGGTSGISVVPNTTPSDTGPPAFGTPVGLDTGPNPVAIAVGDFNGDFRPDLVTANFGSVSGTDGVSVLLNTSAYGSASLGFGGPTNFDAGAQPAAVAVGDLNKDGKHDIAVANRGSSSGSNGVSVLLNTTPTKAVTPSFAGPTHFNAGAAPAGIDIGEINRDFDGEGYSRPDVVVANSGSADGTNAVSVLLNTTPDGGATPSLSGPTNFDTGAGGTSGVALAELTGDTPFRTDIATANTASATGVDGVSVLVNTNTADGATTPSFSGPTNFDAGANPRAISAAGDADFAGLLPDLVVANSGSTGTDAVSVLGNTTTLGAGTPAFTGPTNLNSGQNPGAIAAGDLSGDGPHEIVTANAGNPGPAGVSALRYALPAGGEFSPCQSPSNQSKTWSTTRARSDIRRDIRLHAYATRVLARGPNGAVVFDQTSGQPPGSAEVAGLFDSARAALRQSFGGTATLSGPALESSGDSPGPDALLGTVLNTDPFISGTIDDDLTFGPGTILIGMDQSMTYFVPSGCTNLNRNVHFPTFGWEVHESTTTHGATYALTATLPAPAGAGGSPTPTPTPDLVAATRASCATIPPVIRNRVATLRGGGRATLATLQRDDPAHPLRVGVTVTGGKRVRSVAYRLNGRAIALAAGNTAQLPAVSLRSGRGRNRLDATVTLTDGRRVTITQFFVIVRCSVPVVTCKREAGGRTLRCSSRTPLGVRRVRIRVTGTVGQTVATGSAPVTRGRYTAALRAPAPIAPGRYAYRHTGTTRHRGEKVQMVRVVGVT